MVRGGWLLLGGVVACGPAAGPTAAAPVHDAPTVEVEPSVPDAPPEPKALGVAGSWESGYVDGPHKPPTMTAKTHPGPCERASAFGGKPVAVTETLRYDAQGRLVEKVDGEGKVIATVTYPGEREQVTRYEGYGQRVERRDERGDLVEILELGRDGEPNGRKVFERDAAGRVTRRAVAELGTKLKYYFDIVYDDRGREVRRDYGFFAEPGPFRRWATEYADDGKTAVRTRTRIVDGAVHSTDELRYDEAGRLVERRTLRSDGSEDRITTWSYDAEGRVLESRDDWQGNRSVRRMRYEGGERVEMTRDDGIDGHIDERVVWSYDCW